MFAKWDDIRIPAFITNEEWKFCLSIFKKGEKGTASKQEIEKVNKLLEKNNKGYECEITQEEYEKIDKKVTEEMIKKGQIPRDFK